MSEDLPEEKEEDVIINVNASRKYLAEKGFAMNTMFHVSRVLDAHGPDLCHGCAMGSLENALADPEVQALIDKKVTIELGIAKLTCEVKDEL